MDAKRKFIWLASLLLAALLACAAFFAVRIMGKHGLSSLKTPGNHLPGQKAKSNAKDDWIGDAIERYWGFAADADRKVDILVGFAGISDARVYELVCKALEDPDENVRNTAASLLENFKGNDLIPVVSKALSDRSEEVRMLATLSLQDADSPEVSKLLCISIADEAPDVRDAVFKVLEHQNGETKEILLGEILKSRYGDVRRRLVDLALDTPSHRTVELLLGALRDGDNALNLKIFEAMTAYFSEEFTSVDGTVEWWNRNKDRYDDELFEK